MKILFTFLETVEKVGDLLCLCMVHHDLLYVYNSFELSITEPDFVFMKQGQGAGIDNKDSGQRNNS